MSLLFKKVFLIYRRLLRILVLYIKIILAKTVEHRKRSNFIMSVACEFYQLIYLIMSEKFQFTSQMIKSTRIGNQRIGGVIKLKFLIFGGLSGENCKTVLRSYQVMPSFIKTSALNNSQDYLLKSEMFQLVFTNFCGNWFPKDFQGRLVKQKIVFQSPSLGKTYVLV